MSDKNRWEDIDKLLTRPTEWADAFTPDTTEDPKNKQFLLEDSRVLVIGAGGLGCELLKDLTLVGFKNIDVIDMDTVEVSNLNRQFLFRPSDINKPKAEVAAAFINKRVPGANVIPHYCKIQDKDDDFYSQFNLVIAGLDSIEARRWINTTLVNMVEVDEETGAIDPDTVIPLIDGGTEGFKGQARVILPRVTSCFECSLEMFPTDPLNFPMCTLAQTPRQPEHCVEYVVSVAWKEAFPDKKLDKDNPEHLQWIYERSLERANKFGIKGVTYRLTQGVVKRIIPAIASTNAVIAAACANEAFKVATSCSPYLNNYMMYNGSSSVYTYTFTYEKKNSCPVCGATPLFLTVDPEMTLKDLKERFATDPKLQLKRPSIRYVASDNKTISLYMQQPASLEAQTRPNLDKPLRDLFPDGAYLNVTDPALPGVGVQIKINFASDK
jgi:ubiquitin-activating enzyme E1 C